MVSFAQFQNGIIKYLDMEILSQIEGWKKWTIGAFAGIAVSKSTEIFNSLKNNKMVEALEIIDSNDHIDIDTIYAEFKKQADKGAITFDVPMLGALTLNSTDIENLYAYIKEG